ncbi:hypothetical protein ADIS_1924 [Lunatimonas lonarensis]|uniref:Uncharacterized protein n=1 Tax=Lunatimonas lonarensis TaxID=1232681 RepID=R7ZU87_9BACT|nr:hypothetical protein ADIS_1924 [Lunatimonas lonarensis]
MAGFERDILCLMPVCGFCSCFLFRIQCLGLRVRGFNPNSAGFGIGGSPGA